MTTSGDQTLRRWSDVLMPRTFTVWTMVLAVASVISQAGIIVTGGALRMTASGLGCSEWPRCTPDPHVSSPEMGINGALDFGNRLLTFILAAIAVLMILALWRLRKTHGNLVGMSVVPLCVIPAQAVVGGITVWTDRSEERRVGKGSEWRWLLKSRKGKSRIRKRSQGT